MIFWHPKVLYTSEKLLPFSSVTICLDMEHFVFVSDSSSNRNLKTHSVTKQENPEYQVLCNPTYQIFSLKGEMNRKNLCQSKLFGRQNFPLSTNQALQFADFNFRWCRNEHFTVRLCNNCVPKT